MAVFIDDSPRDSSPEVRSMRMDTTELKLRCVSCDRPVRTLKCLPCLHAAGMCEERPCMENLSQRGLICSECDETFTVPLGGFPTHSFAVRKAFRQQHTKEGLLCNEEHDEPHAALVYCCQCSANLCQECWDLHKSRRVLNRHSVFLLEEALETGVGLKECTQVCAEHGELSNLYCHVCHQLVCFVCTTSGSHRQHKVLVADEELKVNTKATLSTCVSSAKSSIENLSGVSREVDRQVAKLKEQSTSAKAKVNKMIEGLMSELSSRREALIAEIEQTEDEGTRQLEHFREEHVNSKITKLTTCKERTQDVIENGIVEEQISLRRPIVDRISHLSLTSVTPSLPIFPNVDFEEPPNLMDVKRVLSGLGSVSKGVDPPNCSMRGVSVSESIVLYRPWADVPLSFEVVTNDRAGKQWLVGGENVQAIIIPTTFGVPVRGQVEDNGDGTYHVDFKCLPADQSELVVTVNDEQVKGSPVKVNLMNKTDLGATKYELNISGQQWFRALTVGRDGSLIATDNYNHQVCLFDESGTQTSTIQLDTNGRYNGIAELSQGNIAVSSYYDNLVKVFTPQGQVVANFGSKRLNGPKGLAVSNGRIFVVDRCNHRVCVFSEDGRFSHTFGSFGSDPEQLHHPDQIAISKTGYVYVSDWGNKSVKIFKQDGNFVRKLNRISAPSGLAVTNDGHLVVTSFWENSVLIFNAKGERIHSFSNEGPGHPYGLAFGKAGHLYIANLGSQGIVRY